MRNIILTAIAILATGLALTIHPASAQDRAGVFEMAESGIVIEFKMTPNAILNL